MVHGVFKKFSMYCHRGLASAIRSISEYLAQRCLRKAGLLPDTLVGTDSHTTMINGLSVVSLGVEELAQAGIAWTAGLLPHSRRSERSHEGSAAGGVTADLVLH